MKNWGKMAIVALAVLAVTSTGLADTDLKIYTGLGCVPYNDTSPNVSYGTTGRAKNDNGSTYKLLCPIVRDIQGTGPDISDWDVAVDRNGNSATWQISLYSANEYGSSGYVDTITVPTSGDTHVVDGGTITSAYQDGTMFIMTDVPAGSEIRGYRILEEN